MMNRLLYALCLVALLAGFGCGGTSSGHLPVDSPLTPFVPPDREDLIADSDDDGADMDADVAEEDWGDVDDTTPPGNEKKSEPNSPTPVNSK